MIKIYEWTSAYHRTHLHTHIMAHTCMHHGVWVRAGRVTAAHEGKLFLQSIKEEISQSRAGLASHQQVTQVTCLHTTTHLHTQVHLYALAHNCKHLHIPLRMPPRMHTVAGQPGKGHSSSQRQAVFQS